MFSDLDLYPGLQITSDKIVIRIPSNLTLQNSVEFISILGKLPKTKTMTFDCGSVRHVEPFTMLFVSQAIRNFMKSRRPECRFFVRNRPDGTYPAYMGFFSNAKLSRPRDSQIGNPRHLPITRVNCEEVRDEAAELATNPSELIATDSERLARVLAQNGKSETYRFLQYAMQEMMRNVIEHSESKSFVYCGQLWPSKDLVEIGFVDSGIGLRESLSKNPDLPDVDDRSALNLAITPGVSGKKYGKGGQKSKWSNFGYGLYMTSRLCCEGGTFTLISGTMGMTKTATKTNLFGTKLSGTGVRLILKPSKISSLDGSFKRFLDDAKKIDENFDAKSAGLSPSMILKKSF